jgi:hypothetical protein
MEAAGAAIKAATAVVVHREAARLRGRCDGKK